MKHLVLYELSQKYAIQLQTIRWHNLLNNSSSDMVRIFFYQVFSFSDKYTPHIENN